MTFQTRLARIGYVLGTALSVAAVVYFVAPNWTGLSRGAQTALAASLAAVFYGLSFLPARIPLWRRHGDILPLVFLFAGIWAFGAAVLLIHRIYNTQADPWFPLAIWFVPALLFAALLRNVWYDALAYGIGHLALWFLFYPGTHHVSYTDWQQAGIFGLFAAVNLALWAAAERGWWRAGFLKPVTLAVFLFFAVWLSNSFVLDGIGRWLNLASLAALAACLRAFLVRRDSAALSVTGLAASFYAVLKFFELMEDHYSEWFFFLGLLFVALLLAGNVLFFRLVARLAGQGGREAGDAADGGGARGAAGGASGNGAAGDAKTAGEDAGKAVGEDAGIASGRTAEAGPAAARVIGSVVTVAGTVIGAVSLVGLIMLAGESWQSPGLAVFAAGVLLIAAASLVPRLHPAVRNTGLLIGLVAGNFSIFAHEKRWVNLAVLALGVLCWFRLAGTAAKLAAHFITQLTFVFFGLLHLGWHGRDVAWILLVLAAANALLFAAAGRARDSDLRRPLELGGPIFLAAELFALTFLEDVFPGSHALFNAFYFVAMTGLVVLAVRRRRRYDTAVFMAAWLLFAGFKYYDWLWDLLHKSLTMLAAGLILLAASAMLDGRAARREAATGADGRNRDADPGGRSGRPSGGESGRKPARLLPCRRLAAVLLILALQAVYIGGEIAVRERQLAGGATVRLAVHPDDWPHLAVGRTLWVRYDISDLPGPLAEALRESGFPAGGKIRLVLSPDAEGIHRIDRIYREGESVRPGEVVIKGRYDGWGGVRYGIEYRGEAAGGGKARPDPSPVVRVRVSTAGNAVALD